MLWDINKDREIGTFHTGKKYDVWLSRLDQAEIAEIKATLNQMIDGTEVQTSSWMPGSDWRGTPFQAIYEKATKRNPDTAAMCFGLLVWEVFMERPEYWASGHYEKDGVPITGRTYFQVRPR